MRGRVWVSGCAFDVVGLFLGEGLWAFEGLLAVVGGWRVKVMLDGLKG